MRHHPTPASVCQELQTERLLLRAYRRSDADQVAEAIEESRAALEQWTPEIASRRTPEEVAEGLGNLERAWRSRRKLVYGIFERRTAAFVGEVGLYTIDWAVGEATIGIWQRQAACGRGFGHEGFVALTAEALDGLRLGAVEARVHPRNGRSRHLVERAGFELWGTAPGVLAREGTNGEMLVYRRCRGQGGQPSESG